MAKEVKDVGEDDNKIWPKKAAYLDPTEKIRIRCKRRTFMVRTMPLKNWNCSSEITGYFCGASFIL